MPAYMIHTSTQPELPPQERHQMSQVLDYIEGIVESFGGRYRTRMGAFEVLEGGVPANRISLLEFPSMRDLEGFYNSEQYRPYREARQAHGDGTLLVFESAGQ
jgi:uncharacterized protein (DUF1330 family)